MCGERKVGRGWVLCTHRGQDRTGASPKWTWKQNERWLERAALDQGWAEEPRPCFQLVPSGDRTGWVRPLRTMPPGCAYRERPGPGTPANSRGSAISTAPSFYPVGKTSPSAPGIPRAISREETAALQVSFTPLTCPSVPRALPSHSATCPPR